MFFWDDFLAFAFAFIACFLLLMSMFVCFFCGEGIDWNRTRGVGCGNASGPTSGTYLTTSSGILYLRYSATNENITVKIYQDSMLTERLFILPTYLIFLHCFDWNRYAVYCC